MDEKKNTLINELDDYILRLSKQEPPLLDLIARLEHLKALVETANRQELDEILLYWEIGSA